MSEQVLNREYRARVGDLTVISEETDPFQQRFQGVALHGRTPFDVPYISKITDTLWVGGCEDGLHLPPQVEHVVSLYVAESYLVRHVLRSRLQVEIQDSATRPVPSEVIATVARWVASREGVTLVHCQAGLNRSGLVAGAALVLGGMSSGDAVSLLRERRSSAVLCNTAFERWLCDFDERTRDDTDRTYG